MKIDAVIGLAYAAYYGGLAYGCYQVIKANAKDPIHMMQLEGYKPKDYLAWLKDHKEFHFSLKNKSSQSKTPLVWTDRALRLFTTHCRLNAGLVIFFLGLSMLFYDSTPWLVAYALILGALAHLQFYVVALSAKINWQREVNINQGYYDTAKEKIREGQEKGQLKVVGITGSFGKTSTKFMASTILEEAFKVQATPSSFNTPMGLSKVINNDLTEDKEVFVAELGAKEPGEIKEVADLVQPSFGVITAIGPTHMHLFKTLENIQKTKYELIDALPEDGLAIFNVDNSYVRELADREKRKTIRYGMDLNYKPDVYADEIEVTDKGSRFRLHLPGEKGVACTTVLLGKHNISNLLAAASIAYALGMKGKAIAQGIGKVEPVEHRLQLIKGPTGVNVIDDAFNSNPVGARAALDVLESFKNASKIIITPGMVELGDIEEEENEKLGREVAKVVDYCILVGEKRTQPIQRGLKAEGFPEDRLFIAPSLDEATKISAHLTKAGDVVLIENDLPDSYNEI